MASAKPVANEETQPAATRLPWSAAFRRATSEAEAYAGDPKRLRKLLEDAVGKPM